MIANEVPSGELSTTPGQISPFPNSCKKLVCTITSTDATHLISDNEGNPEQINQYARSACPQVMWSGFWMATIILNCDVLNFKIVFRLCHRLAEFPRLPFLPIIMCIIMCIIMSSAVHPPHHCNPCGLRLTYHRPLNHHKSQWPRVQLHIFLLVQIFQESCHFSPWPFPLFKWVSMQLVSTNAPKNPFLIFLQIFLLLSGNYLQCSKWLVTVPLWI